MNKYNNRITESYVRSLSKVNRELQDAFDLEISRLKERERQLQEALRIKTRLDLLNTMDKELKMKDLSDIDNLESSAHLGTQLLIMLSQLQ